MSCYITHASPVSWMWLWIFQTCVHFAALIWPIIGWPLLFSGQPYLLIRRQCLRFSAARAHLQSSTASGCVVMVLETVTALIHVVSHRHHVLLHVAASQNMSQSKQSRKADNAPRGQSFVCFTLDVAVQHVHYPHILRECREN